MMASPNRTVNFYMRRLKIPALLFLLLTITTKNTNSQDHDTKQPEERSVVDSLVGESEGDLLNNNTLETSNYEENYVGEGEYINSEDMLNRNVNRLQPTIKSENISSDLALTGGNVENDTVDYPLIGKEGY